MTEPVGRLGVTFPPVEPRRTVLVHAAVRAEELGYDEGRPHARTRAELRYQAEVAAVTAANPD